MSISRGMPPLACAVVLALGIALLRLPDEAPPSGATPDDPVDDRVAGTVGAPVVTSGSGWAAPLHAGETTAWLWTSVAVQPGQRIAAIGPVRTPRGFLSPGAPDRAALARSRGAAWELTARQVEVLADQPDLAARVWRLAAAAQRTLAGRIPADEPAGAALRGIVTGDRARIPPALDERWRIAGIYHVLSVSGLHLAVIAGLAFAALRRLVAAAPWAGRTRPARWAAPIALAVALGYTLVTGAQLSTLRALVVVTLVLVARMIDRPLRLVDALGAAAIAILLWRPADLHDASFQLSFTAALTLALRPASPPARGARARAVRWLARGLASSAWVAFTTAPITALHFQQVTAGGLIGNLVLAPVVELLALPIGLAGCALGGSGAPLVAVATDLIAAVDAVAGLLARAIPVGTVAVASPAVAAGLVATSLWLAARPRRPRAVTLLVCAGWALARVPAPPGALRVTFLDVGQGDAALVELPDGRVWLIDAGGRAGARDLTTASAPGRVIERALTASGHRAIDLAIVSHPHPDHYLGLASLSVPIRALWSGAPPGAAPPPEARPAPEASGARASFGAVARGLAARGTRLGRPTLGAHAEGDGVELLVWGPRLRPAAGELEELADDPVRSINDNSLVVELRYAGRSLLFAGDLEREGEQALVEAGVARVDVIKVPHHGSRTSSSPPLVLATRPRLAVISCGVGNAFGFPALEVVARWQAAGAAVVRTDRDGAVVVTIWRDGELDVATRAGGASR